MNKVARFEKVSYEQYKKDWIEIFGPSSDATIKAVYDKIKLPKRSTKRSSGYDFFAPIHITILQGRSKTIPTGIRCVFLKDGWDLSIYPRSGLGFKYRCQLDNTVGIIDNDYFESDNEGHIMVRITNDSKNITKTIDIENGKGFVQGIFREFGIVEDEEEITNTRNGGFGSTN